MPRKPSGSAMTGAERIRRYRERLREQGKVQTWVAPGEEIEGLDRRDPQSLIEHWEDAVQKLVTVQRAVRDRNAWIDQRSRRDHPQRHLAREATASPEIEEKLTLITEETDLRTIRLSRRPRTKRLSRAARWDSACGELRGLIDDYQSWHDSVSNLPDGMQSPELLSKLEAMVELGAQIDELEGADLPRGFGRD